MILSNSDSELLIMESEKKLVEKCADIIYERELNEKLGEIHEIC